MNLFHRRRRKRRGRKHAHASGGQEAGLEGTGPKSFSYTLDTTQWPGEETRLEAPASEMGEPAAAKDARKFRAFVREEMFINYPLPSKPMALVWPTPSRRPEART